MPEPDVRAHDLSVSEPVLHAKRPLETQFSPRSRARVYVSAPRASRLASAPEPASTPASAPAPVPAPRAPRPGRRCYIRTYT